MPAPARPAGVSGPGQYARRTDGGPAQALRSLPDAKYGENKAYEQAQRGAPVSQSPGPGAPATPPPQGGQGGAPAGNPLADAVVPFSADTQRPGEPVTSGAAYGPGPGTEALGINPGQIGQQDVSKLAAYLPILEFVANLPSSSPGSRLVVNYLKANQNASASQSPGPAPGQSPVQGAGGPAGPPTG